MRTRPFVILMMLWSLVCNQALGFMTQHYHVGETSEQTLSNTHHHAATADEHSDETAAAQSGCHCPHTTPACGAAILVSEDTQSIVNSTDAWLLTEFACWRNWLVDIDPRPPRFLP